MSLVAERYALALYEICEAKKSTIQTQESLVALSKCMNEHDDVFSALKSPLISSGDKISMLKTALDNQISDELSGFLSLLAKNNRISSLSEIVNKFGELANKHSGIMTGEVRSAVELGSDEKTNLQTAIEAKLSKKVSLQYIIDKDVIGGFEARVGSYILKTVLSLICRS